jgi:hypothetical protein
MIAFRAKDEVQVQAFHAAALEDGGSDEGAPGTRPYYEPTFYVAYVRDPDGNNLACVYHSQKKRTRMTSVHSPQLGVAAFRPLSASNRRLSIMFPEP